MLVLVVMLVVFQGPVPPQTGGGAPGHLVLVPWVVAMAAPSSSIGALEALGEEREGPGQGG